MRTTGWITRVSCVVCLLCGSLMFAQATAPSSKPAAAAPPAKTGESTQKSHHRSGGKKSHKAHTQTVVHKQCNAQTTHGGRADFEPAACPDACNMGKPQSQQDIVVDVDDYIDHGTDPDNVCLRAGDTISYKSSTGRNFKIKDIQSKPGRQAHPFMGKLKASYDSSANGSATQTDKLEVRNSGVPDNGCYVFRPHVEVNKGGGKYDCYDPHIYTDCGDTCDATAISVVQATPLKSGNTTARKSKARKDEAEVPGGR